MVTAAHIMTLAGRLLNDEEAVRWTLPELRDWINEAVRAVVLAKPSASSRTVILSLQQGTLQEIGEGHLLLLRLVRNITDAGPPPVGGRMIRITTRESLDAQEPDWHDGSVVKQKKEVRQFVYDEADPESFYVYPGNDGTGTVEAVVTVLPTAIAADGDEAALASYDQDVGLPETYLPPLLDYVLYRAFLKDSPEGQSGRAITHYQAFAAAVGMKIQVEGANSPNARTRIAGT